MLSRLRPRRPATAGPFVLPAARAVVLRAAAPVVAALLVALAVLVPVQPASAADKKPTTTCTNPSFATQARQATAVFSGEVAAISSSPLTNKQGTLVTQEVQVDLVYKGEGRINSSVVEVRTHAGTKHGCDLGRLTSGETYLFFVTSSGEAFFATGDSGTTKLTAAVSDRIESIFPNPHPPVAAEPETAEFTSLAVTQPRSLARTAAPGAAMALVGVLGLVLLRRFVRH
ncbi:hypothetical protein [Nocardioides sp. GY 10127]|uniref:hypothetical protein n=1 Tax=Nocardioides sp. GY 10127 TaxID=2569762 RepID=UPI0010A93AE2|nr:hypothetical protein [Nocardioides sp. GY 10127]TIC82698.1 hypothetical protein E8D37_08355 [Nocardioides sp. GY 10127]